MKWTCGVYVESYAVLWTHRMSCLSWQRRRQRVLGDYNSIISPLENYDFGGER